MTRTRVAAWILGPTVAAWFGGAATAQLITDDFHTGEDAHWYTRHDPLAPFGAPGTWSFPPGAYRMQGAASPDPAGLGVQRVLSTRNRVGAAIPTPFTLGIDVLDWNPAFRNSIGIFTNLQEIGVGTTDGYFTHVDVGGAGPSLLAFDRIVDDQLTARTAIEIPALTPDHDYSLVIAPTFVFSWVMLYDRADLANPIAYFPLVDPEPLPFEGALGFGVTGVIVEPGVYLNSPVDATFDNFVALPAPGAVSLVGVAAMFRAQRRRPRGERPCRA